MAADHPALHAQGKDFCKYFLENRFRIELARAAQGTVPGQFLIDPVAQEVEHIQTQRALLNKPAVAGDILQIAHQAEFEENHRVNALLPAGPVKPLG